MNASTLTATAVILTILGPPFSDSSVLANDVVGERIEVRIEDLPQPFATPSARNHSIVIERPLSATLRVPPVFKVNAFAEDLSRPRWMAIAPNGDVCLTEELSETIIVLRDSNYDGEAEIRSVYLSGLDLPHGLAFHGGYLYIGETT